MKTSLSLYQKNRNGLIFYTNGNINKQPLFATPEIYFLKDKSSFCLEKLTTTCNAACLNNFPLRDTGKIETY